MRAVVTGMIATYPLGGVAWDYGQYALGLERLGFEVYYLEDTGWQTYDPVKGEYGEHPSYGIRFLRESLAKLSPTLGERWHFRAMDGARHGIPASRFERIVAEADLLLNVSGGTLLRDEYMANPCKIFVDTDPGWNHFVNFPKWDRSPGWQGSQGWRAHDHFFTYAERIGQPDCVLPELGIRWRKTRPPVIPDRWRSRGPGKRWTTVMTWDNFRTPIEYQGVTYGSKELEFGRVEELPRQAPATFEVAVGGANPPRERWRDLGWSVTDSQRISRTAGGYRAYIEGSRGEFSVAKNVYVATRSGWFSCRSVCYLAAGRPVVVQDTGFSEFIPTGDGLLAFSTAEEARQGIIAVEQDYEHHRRKALEVGREYFGADRVLSTLLGEVGLA
jgi:hypothetical protein